MTKSMREADSFFKFGCADCGRQISIYDRIVYDQSSGKAYCMSCGTKPQRAIDAIKEGS